ncbi:bifunctional D-glycero-beta-D-manno-heptose-7-phosphate kinase/D-glycero-beta-D-manno-heptose 1-phosphate adenylyltransferase HldE [Kangiella shandongensis]|uniref:bifunctional D-glycero-beta-D-manno-heptose-7-phosphate kinase/D-glycero-beta-D-manno-heptose 1-phosphate adenylyltransferase HldE n=1 Tax=Kangiella shandongensis TaxID=2763258 RepID=UPI001CBC5622|nr:bifunctional D-glycero-beta-D-manno-heptose-7-phosphate kinase/D-glycero-beta-D-manno-heptose 1-phosphate adenylyltransferase HldE [Kangiella shandongensis]
MNLNLPKFNKARVLVIGDIMLDRYWHGDTSRVSPEAPVPVVNVSQTEDRAGGAGNVALNIAVLGCQVTLCGVTGDDEAAQSLEEILNHHQVSCEFEKRNHHQTITKLRLMSRSQQLLRADFEQEFSLNNGISMEAVNRLVEEHDVIVLSDYGKGTLQDPQPIIQAAVVHQKPVIVDPKGSDFSKYRQATLITPNQSEFDTIAGKSVNEDEFLDKAQKIRQQLSIDSLLVTRSEKGMALFSANCEPYLQATQAQEVYDVTGAGDTVVATLASAMAAGASLQESVQIANLAAGIVVGKLGTATVTTQELHHAMLSHQPLQQGVVSELTLLELIAQAKASGETIVMTNGCFDILHSGHVSYLKQAAELGDRLIVAVNSDDSVKRLKGDSRPLNPCQQRMLVLSELSSVDWVVEFTEDTPQRLIEAMRPDVLVKGGDYKVEEIAGSSSVISNGGDVVILDFVDGVSTTNIINKAKTH